MSFIFVLAKNKLISESKCFSIVFQASTIIPESALVGLNAFGMAYINISTENGDALSFQGDNSPVIEIAVVDNARTEPGRTMPAWRFDKESGM